MEISEKRLISRRIVISGGIGILSTAGYMVSNQHSSSGNPASAVIYRSLNGTPRQCMKKVIETMGGIEKIIGSEDVVLIKPNGQWWNQGAPNLSAFMQLVEMIMDRPGGFCGEVVIGENCHRGASPWTAVSSAWASRFERNSDDAQVRNFNDATARMKKTYGDRFSVCHWIDVDAGGQRVVGPSEGAGYVYCDGSAGNPLIKLDNGLAGEKYRATIMTYPIFKTDHGTIVDFKNGIWERGSYTGKPFKFINLSALNHHSRYCGMTSSIKNYMGISDLSGGADPAKGGQLVRGYQNFHSFPFDEWASGPRPGMLGAEIGVFMNSIRKADINITTADWIGLTSRTELPAAKTRAVLASTDAVALDYHAAKHILYPNSGIAVHDPDNTQGPLRQNLEECARHGGGCLDETLVEVKSYDFGLGRLETDGSRKVSGGRHWGTNLRNILKYIVFRAGLSG
jgi:hypothetical protein